jgi:hypothetical protein
MASYPSRRRDRPMRAYVIRVYDPVGKGAPGDRFAVLATDPGDAMAAMIAGLAPSAIAEVTDEVLDPSAAAGLGLEPRRPVRLA